MPIPYGYQGESDGLIIFQGKSDVVRTIFDYYLLGVSLGKVVDMFSEKRIPSPRRKERWTRPTIDKLLSNAKYVPIVGKEQRCNIDYNKAGGHWKATR